MQIFVRFATVIAVAAGAVLVAALPASAQISGAVVATNGGPLNVRSGPATDKRIVGTLADTAKPNVYCQARGEHIRGHVRESATWLRIGADRWIAEAYVDWSGSRPAVPWCAAKDHKPTDAKVHTSGGELNVRATASSGAALVGTLRNGATVGVQCQAWGNHVDGAAAKTSVWYKIADKRYVSGAYVKWSAGQPWLPWCGQAAPTIPRGGNAGFIDRNAAPAKQSMKETGVPASVTLAQAILETGWGKSALGREDHNIFGMKCFGSPGDIALGCRDYGTFECSPTGGCFDTNATFRAYKNPTDSYRDHGKLLSGWSRYATAMKHKNDPDRFAREIHKAGYATDPKYSDKLINLMKEHNLYQYDR
jgi:uncharacterized protein YraI